MNIKIKELAEQAQDWADAHAPYASEEHEYFVEKFAELNWIYVKQKDINFKCLIVDFLGLDVATQNTNIQRGQTL